MVWTKFGASNRQDRTVGFPEHRLRHAAVKGVRQATSAVRPHDDHIDRGGPGRLKNGIIGKSSTNEILGLHIHGVQCLMNAPKRKYNKFFMSVSISNGLWFAHILLTDEKKDRDVPPASD